MCLGNECHKAWSWEGKTSNGSKIKNKTKQNRNQQCDRAAEIQVSNQRVGLSGELTRADQGSRQGNRSTIGPEQCPHAPSAKSMHLETGEDFSKDVFLYSSLQGERNWAGGSWLRSELPLPTCQ